MAPATRAPIRAPLPIGDNLLRDRIPWRQEGRISEPAVLGGRLGDLPLALPWVTHRVDLFQVPCTSRRAAGTCDR